MVCKITPRGVRFQPAAADALLLLLLLLCFLWLLSMVASCGCFLWLLPRLELATGQNVSRNMLAKERLDKTWPKASGEELAQRRLEKSLPKSV